MDFAEKAGIRVVYMEEFTKLGVAKTIRERGGSPEKGPTYVSFDVDGLDPSTRRARARRKSGFDDAGGAAHPQGIAGAGSHGGDVVEVSPPFDPSGNTALVGATLMFEIMCLLADAVARRRPGNRRPA